RKMRLDGSVNRLANQSDFARGLYGAHPRQVRAEVGKLRQGGELPQLRNHVRLEGVFSAFGLRRELRIDLGEVLQGLEQLGVKQARALYGAEAGALRSVGAFGAQLGSRPFLLPVVVRRDEEN